MTARVGGILIRHRGHEPHIDRTAHIAPTGLLASGSADAPDAIRQVGFARVRFGVDAE